MTRRTSYFLPESSTMNNDTHIMTDDIASAQLEEQDLIPREYQLEMLNESIKRNIIIALDTGSGKTHIAVLRLKLEAERESRKACLLLSPSA
jgi:ERCC4-related helicase